MAKEVAPETKIYGKIVELVCSNGEKFKHLDYEIRPFSASSFYVKRIGDEKQFVIVPTRCVDRIWMEEEADATTVNQPTA